MNPFCEENTWELSQENDNGIEYETKSDDVWELSKSEDELIFKMIVYDECS